MEEKSKAGSCKTAKLEKKEKKNEACPVHDCGSTCQTLIPTSFLSSFLLSVIPDSQVRPEVLGGNPDDEDIRNIIPEPAPTQPPATRLQPFDYDGEVYTGEETEEQPQAKFPEEGEQEEEETVDNQLNPRGDVFSECHVLCRPTSAWVAFHKLTVDLHI